MSVAPSEAAAAFARRGAIDGQAIGLRRASHHLLGAVKQYREQFATSIDAVAARDPGKAWAMAHTAKPILDAFETLALDLTKAADTTAAERGAAELVCRALLEQLEPGARGRAAGAQVVRSVRRFLRGGVRRG